MNALKPCSFSTRSKRSSEEVDFKANICYILQTVGDIRRLPHVAVYRDEGRKVRTPLVEQSIMKKCVANGNPAYRDTHRIPTTTSPGSVT